MRVKKQRKLWWGIVIGCFLILSSSMSVFAADSDLLVDGSWLINAEESIEIEKFLKKYFNAFIIKQIPIM